jgi:hypothetical protein
LLTCEAVGEAQALVEDGVDRFHHERFERARLTLFYALTIFTVVFLVPPHAVGWDHLEADEKRALRCHQK